MLEELDDIIKNFNTTPILFIGSGISRRYLNLPDWKGLLFYFIGRLNSATLDDMAYARYFNEAGKSMPKMATLLEADFNKKWFEDSAFRKVTSPTFLRDIAAGALSPFKVEIAEYIDYLTRNNCNVNSEEYKREIPELRELLEKNISGVITTNYDKFIEQLAPAYKVYTGQDELIFSNIQELGEIYKIHGSIARPDSIVINEEDYAHFKDQCAYLSAKILTLFMEYPIVFLGYSLNDEDVIEILGHIAKCLNNEQLSQLENRMIFVQRAHSDAEVRICSMRQNFGEKSINMKGVKLMDFAVLYRALRRKKRGLPVHVARYYKEEFYRFAITNDPNASVMKVAELSDKRVDDQDLMIAIGTKQVISQYGLVGVSEKDLYEDILFDSLKEYGGKAIANRVLPKLLKRNSNRLPVFKYIREEENWSTEIKNKFKIISDEDFDKLFLNRTLLKQRDRNRNRMPDKDVDSVWQLHSGLALSTVMQYLCCLHKSEINLVSLKNVLLQIYQKLGGKNNWYSAKGSSDFKRLIRIYDWLKNS